MTEWGAKVADETITSAATAAAQRTAATGAAGTLDAFVGRDATSWLHQCATAAMAGVDRFNVRLRKDVMRCEFTAHADRRAVLSVRARENEAWLLASLDCPAGDRWPCVYVRERYHGTGGSYPIPFEVSADRLVVRYGGALLMGPDAFAQTLLTSWLRKVAAVYPLAREHADAEQLEMDPLVVPAKRTIADVTIRPAATLTPAELEAVAGLDGECFGDPWSPGMYREAVRTGALYLAIGAGGQVLGVAVAGFSEPGRVEIQRLLVAAAARRRGIGSALVRAALAAAPKAGASRARVVINRHHDEVRALYRAAGFGQ